MVKRNGIRDEKKTETLEVRLPHSKKRAFMGACHEREISASDAVRGFVDEFVAETERTSTPHPYRVPIKEMSMSLKSHPRKSAGMVLGLGSMAALFAVTPSIADDDVFAALDKNDDGQLSAEELPVTQVNGDDFNLLEAMDANQDGMITRNEFTPKAEVVSVTNEQTTDDDDNPVIRVSGRKTAYDISDPDEVKIFVKQVETTYPGTSPDEVDKAMAQVREALEKDDMDLVAPKGSGKKIIKRVEREIEKSD